MTVYCLTLNPLKADIMGAETWCSGWMTSGGMTHVPVVYDYKSIDRSEGDDAADSIQQAADTLDTEISNVISGATTVYVAGHSKGAQVIGRWLIKYAPTSGFDSGKLKFITTGNPTSAYGHVPWIKYEMPTSTAYSVLDIGREYDGWCRWPDSPSLIEFIRAIVGMFTDHPGYPKVTLGATGVPTSYQSTGTIGTTTWYTID